MAEYRYEDARQWYAGIGVDTEQALERLRAETISLHCWQGDDVRGFEAGSGVLSGGIAVTGNHPGAARDVAELRADLERALSLLPGAQRLNLHASYGEFGGMRVDRDALEPEHFRGWIEWAAEHRLGLDFNPTFFSHPLSAEGTLSHLDPAVRGFWIEHGKRSRQVARAMGRALGTPAINNFWIPDGSKDNLVDRLGPRERLTTSLDEIFSEPIDPSEEIDTIESKLFGLGSETYVVGSHEFYLGYALSRNKWLCLDAGHFHPTESIADKISALAGFVPGLLLHVSRGVRWDSDHVVTQTDDLQAIAHEIVRSGMLGRCKIGLDFFDGSINRVAAWMIGVRAMRKALLIALLEPLEELRKLERDGDFSRRLAWLEELKMAPVAAVWEEFCEREGVPAGMGWLDEAEAYEKRVLSQRGVAAVKEMALQA